MNKNNLFVKFENKEMTHNLPKKLSDIDGRYVFSLIASELINRTEENFVITIEKDSNGDICGGGSDLLSKEK